MRFAIQWHITNLCDQRCSHCYIKDGERNEIMDMDRCIKTLESIELFCKRMGREPYLVITGGDPLLHPEFRQLALEIKKRNIGYCILGNPFHLHRGSAIFLKDTGCELYQLSFDGLKETHDTIRMQGSFDTTLKSIGILDSQGIKATAMCTVSKTNIAEIPALMDYLLKNTSLGYFSFARYCPSGPEDAAALNVPPLEFRNLLAIVWDQFGKEPIKLRRFYFKDHLWKLFHYEKGTFNADPRCRQILSGCNCALNHLTILPNGDVHVCRRFESKAGNVFLEDLEYIFRERMAPYRHIEKLEKCSCCELKFYCRGCGAVSYGTYGSFFMPDPQCWKE